MQVKNETTELIECLVDFVIVAYQDGDPSAPWVKRAVKELRRVAPNHNAMQYYFADSEVSDE